MSYEILYVLNLTFYIYKVDFKKYRSYSNTLLKYLVETQNEL